MMQTNVVLRDMRPDEASILLQTGKQYFSPIERMGMPEPRNALVATVDGNLAGALFYKEIDSNNTMPIAYIDLAYVVKDYRGMGIGKLLYQNGVDRIKEKGYKTITAMVADDNVASWGLFQKQGFNRVSFTEMFSALGLKRGLAFWFRSLFSISCGLNMWMNIQAKERSTISEIMTYLLLNALLIMPFCILFGFINKHSPMPILLASISVLLVSMISGYIGGVITKEQWKFGLTRGGLAISLPLQLICIFFPLLGRWYPADFYKSEKSKQNLGIQTLIEWVGLLIFSSISFIFRDKSFFWQWFNLYTGAMLLYHIIAIFPTEHFGGKRVLKWSKVAFSIISILSCIQIILTLFY